MMTLLSFEETMMKVECFFGDVCLYLNLFGDGSSLNVCTSTISFKNVGILIFNHIATFSGYLVLDYIDYQHSARQ